MKTILIFLIRAYQSTVAPFWGPSCRFFPTCSHYGEEAIAKKGWWKGSLAAAARIFRCHPFHAGGWDPVL